MMFNRISTRGPGQMPPLASTELDTVDIALLTAWINPSSAPVIIAPPVSQTVAAGGNVTFTVAAAGTPAPTYQWQKNGADIGGATDSSYTIANAAAGDAGNYSVTAANSVGSVNSAAAMLVVMVAPYNAIIMITIQ
jgi:hypothetical protein